MVPRICFYYLLFREYNIRPVLPQSVYRHSEGQLRMDVVDYESAAPFIRFPTENSYDPDKGFKPVITANSMNFTSLTSIKNFVMNHPIFGTKDYLWKYLFEINSSFDFFRHQQFETSSNFNR